MFLFFLFFLSWLSTMFEIFTWNVGGISQDLFTTNEYALLWERHDACGAGSVPLKPSLISWGSTPTLLMEPPPIFRLRDWSVCRVHNHSCFLFGPAVNSKCPVGFLLLQDLCWVRKFAWTSPGTCLAVPTCPPPPISQTKNTFSEIDSIEVISFQCCSIAFFFSSHRSSDEGTGDDSGVLH